MGRTFMSTAAGGYKDDENACYDTHPTPGEPLRATSRSFVLGSNKILNVAHWDGARLGALGVGG